jgi:hypothetical protein
MDCFAHSYFVDSWSFPYKQAANGWRLPSTPAQRPAGVGMPFGVLVGGSVDLPSKREKPKAKKMLKKRP